MRTRQVGAAFTVLAMLACIVPTIAIPAVQGEMLGLFAPDLGGAVAFSLVGAFLLVRGAVVKIAVVMCVQGIGSSLTSLTLLLFNRAAEAGPLHGVDLWVAWVNSIVWIPGVVCTSVVLLIFPNGRFAGRRWRWVALAAAGFGALFEFLVLFGRQGLVDTKPYAFSPNPTGVLDLPSDLLSNVSFFGMIGCIAVSLGSLVIRRRVATGVERAQYTSLLFGAAVSVSVLAYVALQATLLQANVLIFVLELFAIAPIAVAVGVAVLRYRLYEIDKVVSRTVTYVLVIAMLAGVYIGVVAGLASFVPDDLGQVGVGVATLLVSVLAVPLTRRLRRVVDRRFDRSRFDAARVATAFAARLRARPERGDVPADLLAVVRRTVAPAHAGVWLVPS